MYSNVVILLISIILIEFFYFVNTAFDSATRVINVYVSDK